MNRKRKFVFVSSVLCVFSIMCSMFSFIFIFGNSESSPLNNAISTVISQEINYRFNQEGFNNDISKSDNLLKGISGYINEDRKEVIIGGELIGLKLKTNGVLIVGTESFEGEAGNVFPAEKAGLCVGDVLLSVDNKIITSNEELAAVIEESQGSRMLIRFMRDNKEYETEFFAEKSKLSGMYKGGIWVRDSTGGIGTLTYIDYESNTIATLGHGIYDVDTKKLLPAQTGGIFSAKLNGVKKGTHGMTGELIGSIGYKNYGEIMMNDENGVYGTVYHIDQSEDTYPVAKNDEITTGKAQIVSTVSENGKQFYDIEIKKIDKTCENKNLIIEVTDEDLLSITGGIVQGMSGSPIVQNGMIVGAVTHVFLNNPTKGYGILIENMLETAA